MPATAETTTIEVDTQAAEILRRASEAARAQGQTLGAYLQRTLNSPALSQPASKQRDAWAAFVTGMTGWARLHLPAGHAVDDSRGAMYDDRD